MLDTILHFFGLQRKQEPVVEEVVREVIKEVIREPERPHHTIVGEMCIDYIVGEKLKFFPIHEQKQISASLRDKLSLFTLPELEVLVKIISKHYRKNAIYDYFFQKGYSWSKERVGIENIYLTKINEKTNAILESLPRQYNLSDLLSSYSRGELPSDCELFTFDQRKIENFYPVCVQRKDGRIDVLDGNHRICVWSRQRKFKMMEIYLGRLL